MLINEHLNFKITSDLAQVGNTAPRSTRFLWCSQKKIIFYARRRENHNYNFSALYQIECEANVTPYKSFKLDAQ